MKLRLLVAALALGFAAPAAAQDVSRWRPYIAEASARFGVPEDWIVRVMRAESAGLTMLHGRPITSHAGAMGLMQIMPGTWAELRARLGLGDDPHDPRDNILAGTFYLRLMYERFGYPGLFGAYNAGPGRYAAHLAGRASLPDETRAYLANVAGHAGAAAAAVAPPVDGRPRTAIFFAVGAAQATAAADRPSTSSLFVPLSGIGRARAAETE